MGLAPSKAVVHKNKEEGGRHRPFTDHGECDRRNGGVDCMHTLETAPPLNGVQSKRNPLESPTEAPFLATTIAPPTGPLQFPLQSALAPSRGAAPHGARCHPRPQMEMPTLPPPNVLRAGRGKSGQSPRRARSVSMHDSHDDVFADSASAKIGGEFRSHATHFGSPTSCHGSGIARTIPSSASVTSYNHRRLYVGEEIEFPSDEDACSQQLDDFALASSRSVKLVAGKRQTSLSASKHSMPEIRLADPSRSAQQQQQQQQQQRGILQALATSPLTLGMGTPSSSTPNRQSRLCGSSQRDASDGEVLEFLSFRRPGFSDCRLCLKGLAYGSNYCSHCGTPTEAAMRTPDGISSNLMSGAGCNRPWGPFGTSAYGHSPLVSSGLTTPAADRDDEAPGVISFACSPATPELYLSPSETVAQRRKVYRRQVKVTSRFAKHGLLGSGANGTVLKAVDIYSGQQLAMKEMFMNPQDDEEVAAIRSELSHLSKLRHRNIIEYLGCSITPVAEPHDMISLLLAGEDVDTPRSPGCDSPSPQLDATARGVGDADDKPASRLRVCILMELMESGTLENLMEEFPDGMPESAAAQYVGQLVDAVNYLHSCNLTHRDIKPSNILLTSHGEVKLSDFGCAMITASAGGSELLPIPATAASASGAPKIQGTPAYMPPEAFSAAGKTDAELAHLWRAQDVWAIGCVAHQLLTGEVPWSFLSLSHPFALALHLQNELGPTGTFPIHEESLSPAAIDFCRRCFEREPSLRATPASLLDHPFITRDNAPGW